MTNQDKRERARELGANASALRAQADRAFAAGNAARGQALDAEAKDLDLERAHLEIEVALARAVEVLAAGRTRATARELDAATAALSGLG